MPFVHIQLEGVALGTVTEADGNFRISIPSRYAEYDLVFSYLGYESKKIKVNSLKRNTSNTIPLKMAAEVLSEVTITPKKLPSARAILRRVFKNLENNYADSASILNGYYRETIKENGVYMKFADAACSYHNAPYPEKKLKWKDYSSAYGNYYSTMSTFSDFAGAKLHRIHFHHRTLRDDQVKIIDSRASLNGSSRNMNANITGGPLSLFARNRVKYQQSFLGPKRNRDFEYLVDEVQDEQGKWIYQLHFKTKVSKEELDKLENPKNRKQWNKANKHKLLEGNLYINPEDYAVLHYECWIPNELKPYFCGFKVMAIKHFDYKLDVHFKKSKGKYRLDRIYHEDEFIFKDTTDNTVTPYAAISEFNTLDVQVDGVKAFPAKVNFANVSNNQLYDYALEYDSIYWTDYTLKHPIANIDSTIRKDMELDKTLEEQFRDKQLRDPDLLPPIAPKVTQAVTIHDTKLLDDYAWMKDTKNPRSNSKVMDYLHAENEYTDNYFIPLRKLQRELSAQLRFTVEKDYTSLPVKENGYLYYSSYSGEQEHPVYYRTPIGKPQEKEILLDVNTMVEENYFYQAGGIQVSPNNNIISFYENTTGSDRNVLKFKNLSEGSFLKDSLTQIGNLVWVNDSTLLYAHLEPKTLRSSKIMRHKLGTPQAKDELVFHEQDPRFDVSIYRSKSKKFLFINSGSSNSNELRLLSTQNPYGVFKVVEPRSERHSYGLVHYKDKFYVISDRKSVNNGIYVTDTSKFEAKHWQPLIKPRKNVLINGVEIFDRYLVLSEKANTQNRIRVIDQGQQKEHYIEFKEEFYDVSLGYNPESNTDTLQIGFSSFLTPGQVLHYNMDTQKSKLIKKSRGSVFSIGKFEVQQEWATAPDGTAIPITLIYNKWSRRAAERYKRVYLTSYGAYGSGQTVGYSSFVHTLLNKGFIYAIAHVRGGDDMGMEWYEDGKMLKKKNTFTDFIACAERLIELGHAEKGSITASGGSAGGLLMGAVANMRPDLFKAIFLEVPFVDVINTMLDDQLPLTSSEYLEWGNPNNKKHFNYMHSYSPYDNVKAQDYPNLYFFTGLNDTRVGYWEPAKMVAKLRSMKTDDNLLLLKTNLYGGHGGGSGRYAWIQDASFKLALIFDLYNN